MYKCGKCDNEFEGYPIIRRCPHPVVNEKLGKYVCYFCCKKCRHNDNKVLGVRCIYPNSN